MTNYKFFHLIFFTLFWTMPFFSFAKCIFPLADGGIDNVSNRNVVGTIISIDKNNISIKEPAGNIYVVILKNDVVYTSYGGDGSASDLKKGLSVRVWLKNCEKPTSKGVSSYFEVDSFDAKIKPEKNYFFKPGQ